MFAKLGFNMLFVAIDRLIANIFGSNKLFGYILTAVTKKAVRQLFMYN